MTAATSTTVVEATALWTVVPAAEMTSASYFEPIWGGISFVLTKLAGSLKSFSSGKCFKLSWIRSWSRLSPCETFKGWSNSRSISISFELTDTTVQDNKFSRAFSSSGEYMIKSINAELFYESCLLISLILLVELPLLSEIRAAMFSGNFISVVNSMFSLLLGEIESIRASGGLGLSSAAFYIFFFLYSLIVIPTNLKPSLSLSISGLSSKMGSWSALYSVSTSSWVSLF